MAYFPDLFTQSEYEQKWCVRCVNYRAGYCPILDIHESFGKGQFANATVKAILDTLIQYDGANEQCTMFMEQVQ